MSDWTKALVEWAEAREEPFTLEEALGGVGMSKSAIDRRAQMRAADVFKRAGFVARKQREGGGPPLNRWSKAPPTMIAPDAWDGPLVEWAIGQGEPFTIAEALAGAVGMNPADVKQPHFSRAGSILTAAGYRRLRSMVGGVKTYRWSYDPTSQPTPKASRAPKPPATTLTPADLEAIRLLIREEVDRALHLDADEAPRAPAQKAEVPF